MIIVTEIQELSAVIEDFESELPGWWWTIGKCDVGVHASCGPKKSGPDADLLKDHLFDGGFHSDLPSPARVGEALAEVHEKARRACDDFRRRAV